MGTSVSGIVGDGGRQGCWRPTVTSGLSLACLFPRSSWDPFIVEQTVLLLRLERDSEPQHPRVPPRLAAVESDLS